MQALVAFLHPLEVRILWHLVLVESERTALRPGSVPVELH